ncbi:heterokaryon incompatibility protein-domain-containing protein [Xylariaceae sp. FL0804]|nr:heterokaryon incompatibility protein-domain-containing protein [Xylariaceae sp. FL0804]
MATGDALVIDSESRGGWSSESYYQGLLAACWPGCIFTDERHVQTVPPETEHTEPPHSGQPGENAVYSRALGPGQIRVLSLHPGALADELSADLHVVDMLHGRGGACPDSQTVLDYSALSYCWGDPTPCRLLVCNGHPLAIPREAYRALRRLRSADDLTYLWIDAICINQADLEEKAAQVPRIMDVYKNAARVIVWLGESNLLVRLAALVLHETDRQPAGPGQITVEGNTHDPRGRILGPGETARECCTGHVNAACYGLHELLDRPWFKRVWVKQEIWAAREVRVQCSELTFPWETFQAVHDGTTVFSLEPRLGESWYFESFLKNMLRSVVSRLPIGNDELYRRARARDGPNPRLDDSDGFFCDIVNVLRRAGSSECSVKQDHIFGLLGMSSMRAVAGDVLPGHSENGVTVTYKTSPSSVFQNTARYIMHRDGCLNVMYLDEVIQNLVTGTIGGWINLPSWCPDWAYRTGSMEWLWELVLFDEAISFHCDIPTAIDEEDILRLRGFRVGVIRDTDPHRPSQQSRMQVNAISWYEATVAPLLGDFAAGGDGRSVLDAFPLSVETFCSAESRCCVPCRREPGDMVIVAEGAWTPLVLRPASDGRKGTWRYNGPAILYDIESDTGLAQGNADIWAIFRFLRQLLESGGPGGELESFLVR